MSRAVRIAGLSLVCALATPAPTSAQQRLPLELSWQAPAECPSADDVRAQLERIARVRPGFGLTPLSASAQVTHGDAGYAVKLQTRHDGRDGERDLHATDCATLVRTLTLVLALAFGEGVELAESNGPDTSASTATAEKQPTAASDYANAEPDANAEPSDAANADNRSAVAKWALLSGGGAQFGLLPSTAFAATAGAELSLRAFSIELRATAWPGVTVPVAPGLQAHLNGLLAAAQGCARIPLSSLKLALCAGARAAAIHGRSDGASDDGSTTAPWYALSGATSLTFPRDRTFAVRIEAALAASLNRPRFVIDNLAQVHRIPLLVPDLSALLVIAL